MVSYRPLLSKKPVKKNAHKLRQFCRTEGWPICVIRNPIAYQDSEEITEGIPQLFVTVVQDLARVFNITLLQNWSQSCTDYLLCET